MHVYVYSVYINTENMIKIKTIAQLNCSNWNTGNCMGCVFSRVLTVFCKFYFIVEALILIGIIKAIKGVYR